MMKIIILLSMVVLGLSLFFVPEVIGLTCNSGEDGFTIIPTGQDIWEVCIDKGAIGALAGNPEYIPASCPCWTLNDLDVDFDPVKIHPSKGDVCAYCVGYDCREVLDTYTKVGEFNNVWVDTGYDGGSSSRYCVYRDDRPGHDNDIVRNGISKEEYMACSYLLMHSRWWAMNCNELQLP